MTRIVDCLVVFACCNNDVKNSWYIAVNVLLPVFLVFGFLVAALFIPLLVCSHYPLRASLVK